MEYHTSSAHMPTKQVLNFKFQINLLPKDHFHFCNNYHHVMNCETSMNLPYRTCMLEILATLYNKLLEQAIPAECIDYP